MTGGDKMGAVLPWRTTATEVVWPSADESISVTFDSAGMCRVRRSDERERVERVQWSSVLDLTLRVPYASTTSVRSIEVWNMISPKYGEHSSDGVEISFRSGYREILWDLGRTVQCSWRLEFLLTDLLYFLNDQRLIHVLGEPGFLDDFAKLLPMVPRRARSMMYIDLFGLDRFVGGHGSLDSEIRTLTARYEHG